MITLGLGIDAVEIKRFTKWHLFARKTLKRIFSEEELNYCLSIPKKTSERFAARFAAKEAFFKAISPLLTKPVYFLQVLPHISVSVTQNNWPELKINWGFFELNKKELKPKTLISLTHTSDTATAVVIITK